MADTEALAGRLTSVVSDALGEDVLVTDLRRLSGGASRETWSFDATGPGGTRPLILRRDPPGAMKGGMDLEARLLQAAGGAGVRVPAVLAASDDPGVMDTSFLVMERVEGEAIARKLLRDDEFAKARPRMAADAGVALARLHSIDVATVEGLEASDPVAQWRDTLDLLGQSHPAFELTLRWLEEHRPPPRPPAIVHGDFRTGNLLVDRDGLAAVLDWELAHAGDPLEDLGWFCVRSWRFGATDKPAGGFGSYEELIAAYEDAGGGPVDRDALHWWETLGTLKWGVICIMQANAHLSGLIRSVELAAIGRRVCENEWDVLLCLDQAGWPGPGEHRWGVGSSPRENADLHGRPTAAELVEAVRLYLEEDVMASTTGRVQFHARVAARALATIERELLSGEVPAIEHTARLSFFGCADDAALSAAIRGGSLDDRLPAVRDAIRLSVRAKLEVANPPSPRIDVDQTNRSCAKVAPVHVGIIGGTGPAGMGLAVRLAAAGVDVTVGSRTATRAKEHVDEALDRWPGKGLTLAGDDNNEAARAPIVVLATPWDAAVATARNLAEPLKGKTLVSMCNALIRVGDEFQWLIPARGSVAESLQTALPETAIGAAFHHLPARLLSSLDQEMDCDVLVCADRADALDETVDLVNLIPGLRPIVAGTLSMAGAIEAFTAVLLNVNVRHKARSAVKLTGL